MKDPPEPSVWENTVDDQTWTARVTRESDYRGTLTVVRASDDKEILREEVGLSYQAIFGPDVDDVNMWMTMTIEAIDHFNASSKEP